MATQVMSRAAERSMQVRILTREPLLRCSLKNTVISRSHDDRAELDLMKRSAEQDGGRDLDGVSSTERVSVHESNGALDDILFYPQQQKRASTVN